MTERGDLPGAAGPEGSRRPDTPPWVSPSDRSFEPLLLTTPDHVLTALCHPPATEPTTDPHNRVAAADPVVRRLAELSVDSPPAFDVPHTGRSHAATLAAHCPDLFLVSAPADRRVELVAELVVLAAQTGQRVLILADDAEAVLTTTAARTEVAIGRAVGPEECITDRACVAFTAHTRGQRYCEQLRVGLTDRVAVLQVRINTEERREKLRAEADTIAVDRNRVGELVAFALEQSEEMKALVATRDAGVAAVAAHTAVRVQTEQELITLRQSAAQPVGFFKKLFGGAAKPEPSKIESLEAKLRELDATAPADPHAAFTTAREKLLSDQTTAHRAELETKLATVQGQLDQLPPAEPLDDLCRAFDDATADLAHLDAGPFTLPAAEMDAVRVIIGPPSAIGHDPFLTGTHPEVEPRFDRIVWVEAEPLTDDTFATVARLGAAWVLVGTPDPLHPPGYRNGRPRSPFFSGWWHRLHTAAWTHESDRPLARLLSVADRDELQCEAVHGHADIEVRWADRDGSHVLAEVLFPVGMPLADAKAFLALEAGEVRCSGFGPCEWDTTDEAIRCRWPAVDAATGTRDAADLGDGVQEQTVAGLTTTVTFCAKTWTRDTATRWLSERLLPPVRTVIV